MAGAINHIRSLLRLEGDSAGSVGRRQVSLALGGPLIVAHGAGVGGWDEAVIFGGIGLIVVALIFMSWRAGRKRKAAEARRRKPR